MLTWFTHRIKTDPWLYVICNRGSKLEVYLIPGPVRSGWKTVARIGHDCLRAKEILEASE